MISSQAGIGQVRFSIVNLAFNTTSSNYFFIVDLQNLFNQLIYFIKEQLRITRFCLMTNNYLGERTASEGGYTS